MVPYAAGCGAAYCLFGIRSLALSPHLTFFHGHLSHLPSSTPYFPFFVLRALIKTNKSMTSLGILSGSSAGPLFYPFSFSQLLLLSYLFFPSPPCPNPIYAGLSLLAVQSSALSPLFVTPVAPLGTL